MRCLLNTLARALAASPLEDIRALLDVGFVMKGGNIYIHPLR